MRQHLERRWRISHYFLGDVLNPYPEVELVQADGTWSTTDDLKEAHSRMDLLGIVQEHKDSVFLDAMPKHSWDQSSDELPQYVAELTKDLRQCEMRLAFQTTGIRKRVKTQTKSMTMEKPKEVKDDLEAKSCTHIEEAVRDPSQAIKDKAAEVSEGENGEKRPNEWKNSIEKNMSGDQRLK